MNGPQDIHQQIRETRQRQAENEAAGVPALMRLVEVARKNSGQSRHIRRFLLGLYNGPQWPFEMTQLRALDEDLQKDALAVLRMDMRPRHEVHTYIEDGDELWREWWEQESETDE